MLHIIEHSDWLKLVTWLATSNQSALFQCCIASLHSLQLVKSSMSNVKPNNYRQMFPYTKQGEHQSTVLYEATVRPFKNTYHCLLTFSLSLSLSLSSWIELSFEVTFCCLKNCQVSLIQFKLTSNFFQSRDAENWVFFLYFLLQITCNVLSQFKINKLWLFIFERGDGHCYKTTFLD